MKKELLQIVEMEYEEEFELKNHGFKFKQILIHIWNNFFNLLINFAILIYQISTQQVWNYIFTLYFNARYI